MKERLEAYRDHYASCYNAALARGDQYAANESLRLFYEMVDSLTELS